MKLLFMALNLAVDGLAAVFALVLTYTTRFGMGKPDTPVPADLTTIILFMTAFWWALFLLRGLYASPVILARFDELFNLFKSVLIGIILIFLATFDASQPLRLSRLYLLGYGGLLFIFAAVGRMAVWEFQVWLRWKGKGLADALIIGADETGMKLRAQLKQQPSWGFRVVGFVDDEAPLSEENIGRSTEVRRLCSERNIHWLLFAGGKHGSETAFKVMDECYDLNLRYLMVADYYQMAGGLVHAVQVHGLPLVELSPQTVAGWLTAAKRGIDVLLGLMGSLVFIVSIPVLGLITSLVSRGPVLVTLKMVGKKGRLFQQIRYRVNVDVESGAPLDKWSGFLRRSRLEKLPSFLNILMGQMSLIGPEPLPPEQFSQYRGKVRLFMRRLRVRPGLTGWAQIRYAYENTLEDQIEKTKYDLYYIDHISLALDFWIFLAASKRIILGSR